ncbi:MAG: hypothetical protein ABL973_15425 [Micropepsaceae bacterium]
MIPYDVQSMRTVRTFFLAAFVIWVSICFPVRSEEFSGVFDPLTQKYVSSDADIKCESPIYCGTTPGALQLLWRDIKRGMGQIIVNFDNEKVTVKCTGTQIASDLVLTAAHCLHFQSKGNDRPSTPSSIFFSSVEAMGNPNARPSSLELLKWPNTKEQQQLPGEAPGYDWVVLKKTEAGEDVLGGGVQHTKILFPTFDDQVELNESDRHEISFIFHYPKLLNIEKFAVQIGCIDANRRLNSDGGYLDGMLQHDCQTNIGSSGALLLSAYLDRERKAVLRVLGIHSGTCLQGKCGDNVEEFGVATPALMPKNDKGCVEELAVINALRIISTFPSDESIRTQKAIELKDLENPSIRSNTKLKCITNWPSTMSAENVSGPWSQLSFPLGNVSADEQGTSEIPPGDFPGFLPQSGVQYDTNVGSENVPVSYKLTDASEVQVEINAIVPPDLVKQSGVKTSKTHFEEQFVESAKSVNKRYIYRLTDVSRDLVLPDGIVQHGYRRRVWRRTPKLCEERNGTSFAPIGGNSSQDFELREEIESVGLASLTSKCGPEDFSIAPERWPSLTGKTTPGKQAAGLQFLRTPMADMSLSKGLVPKHCTSSDNSNCASIIKTLQFEQKMNENKPGRITRKWQIQTIFAVKDDGDWVHLLSFTCNTDARQKDPENADLRAGRCGDTKVEPKIRRSIHKKGVGIICEQVVVRLNSDRYVTRRWLSGIDSDACFRELDIDDAEKAGIAPVPQRQFIIFFGFNKCNITAEADAVLREAAAEARVSGKSNVTIQEVPGTPSKLGECHRKAVSENLKGKGINAENMFVSYTRFGNGVILLGEKW